MNKHIAQTFSLSVCLARAGALFLACAFCCGGASAAATLPPAFVPASMPTGWVGEVEVSNFDFSSDNENLFKTTFDKSHWTGNLYAYPVGANGSLNFADERWGGVADQVDVQDFDTGRSIVTLKGDGSAKIPFRWASMTSTQQHAFDTDNTKSQNIVNYIRGDHKNEVSSGATGSTHSYRDRTSVVGDFIHSRPLFVPDPVYPRVYVGGNDGMLHAYDACDSSNDGCNAAGSEVFAYIPSMLIDNATTGDKQSPLNALTVTTYGTSSTTPHQYFVDGSPNARTVTIGGTTKTILVGGLGAGGIGLYALEISNPGPGAESTDKDRIKWEITNTTINNVANTAYANLGYTYGVPLIARLQDGTWVAIVGNGYNNTASHEASLYIINLDTGAKIAEMTANIGGAADDPHPNGLSSPAALDVNGDGKVDYVYAGDIAGNVWKFDLHTSGSYPNGALLFSTPNANVNQNASNGQAITGAPSTFGHPLGGFMINFATGRMFTDCLSGTVCDRTSTATQAQQYAYGVWDTNTPPPGTALASVSSPQVATSDLVDQGVSSISTFTSRGLTFSIRTSSAINAVTYTGVTPKKGWRLLLASGERVVGDGGLIADGRYHFSVTNPTFDNGAGAAMGDNWLFEVDFLTGTAPSAPFFDMNFDTIINDDDLVADTGQAYQLRIPVAKRIASGGVMSQPLLAQLLVQSETYFNTNPDTALATNPSGNLGITNGHFDWDIYYPGCTPSTGGYKCAHNVHSHQYDDKYNVTGVDFQNSSLATVDLALAFAPVKGSTTTTSTKFKILVANQKLSPAAGVKIGDTSASYVQVTTVQTSATPALGTGTVLGTNTPFSDSLTTYSLKGVTVAGATTLANFYIDMPLQAFTQADWAAGLSAPWSQSCNPATNPNCEVGIIPTQTGCVHANSFGFTDVNPPTTLLPYGNLWMNGALTFEVIKDTTPDSAIRLERVGDPSFGYRLKSDAVSQAYQLAQFTIFWHHPNGKCYGQSGWGTTAAIAYPDTAGSATATTKAPGSDDPTDGAFTGGGGGTGGGGTQTGGGGGVTSTTTTIVLADGTTIVETVTRNTDGTITITIAYPDGHTDSFDVPAGGGGREADDRVKSGRISWKEMKRCPVIGGLPKCG